MPWYAPAFGQWPHWANAGSALEKSFRAMGWVETDGTIPTPGVPPDPAAARLIKAINGKLADSAGAITLAAADVGALDQTVAARRTDLLSSGTLDPDQARLIVPAQPITTISTPDGTGELIHPSVVDTYPTLWNGHRYWLAGTPYPGADTTKENPCIYYSDDGLTWTVPAGLTNPIEPAPTTGYNSDTHMLLGTNGRMYCIWRRFGGAAEPLENIYYRSSADGVDWSDRQVVLSNTSTASRPVSPAIVYDNGIYHMWVCDLVPTPMTIHHHTATSLTGPWSVPTVCTVSPGWPTGRNPWHLDVKRYGGEWHMLIQDEGGSKDGGQGDLYFARSTDGNTWTRSLTPIAPRQGGYWTQWYRSAMVAGQRNGRVGYDVWATTWGAKRRISRSFLEFTGTEPETLRHARDAVTAKAGVLPWKAADTFTRADAATLGNAETGQAWTASAGAPGIVGNAAGGTTAANTRAVLDTGTADGWFEVTVASLAGSDQTFLVFRSADSSNYWRFGYAGSIQLQKIVAGSLVAVSIPETAGLDIRNTPCRLAVRCQGTSIQCYVNGVAYGPVIVDAHAATATQAGWNTNTNSARFKDFLARTL